MIPWHCHMLGGICLILFIAVRFVFVALVNEIKREATKGAQKKVAGIYTRVSSSSWTKSFGDSKGVQKR